MRTVWEEIFVKGGLWGKEPHPEIEKIVKLFKKSKVKRILDVGSGEGRHVVYLSSKGFDVYGLDISPAGLQHTLDILSEKDLAAHLTLHDMVTLPYDDEYFDAVISVQVIHHNKLIDIHNTVEEITRVLKINGLTWITMPVSKNEPSTKQKEIEPGTFIPLDGIEKGLPHHYFKKEEIPSLFPGFSVIDLYIDPLNHFSLVAKKVSNR